MILLGGASSCSPRIYGILTSSCEKRYQDERKIFGTVDCDYLFLSDILVNLPRAVYATVTFELKYEALLHKWGNELLQKRKNDSEYHISIVAGNQ